MQGLDAWITGNYGEDHPANFGECIDCGKRVELSGEEDGDEIMCNRCGRAAAEED